MTVVRRSSTPCDRQWPCCVPNPICRTICLPPSPALQWRMPALTRCLFSALCLLGGLVVNGPLVAQPNPFPPGAAVYEWHYTCPHNNPDGTCRFSVAAANYSANNVADAQIVLAFQTVGSSQQIPFYYFWITSMGRKKPDFVMLQSNAAVSFVAQGMTMHNGTGPITSESDQHVK